MVMMIIMVMVIVANNIKLMDVKGVTRDRADLAVVVFILLVPDGLVGKDNEGGNPGHSLPGGHNHLEGESHFIIALSWQP